jgi:hypothetical protein
MYTAARKVSKEQVQGRILYAVGLESVRVNVDDVGTVSMGYHF